jgi:hypothetical protein
MTKWLHKQGFSYKKPKGTPAKADLQKQAAFIAYYENLLNTIPEDEPIEFGDGVHPTMATKITYGWIKKGTDRGKFNELSESEKYLCNPLNSQLQS